MASVEAKRPHVLTKRMEEFIQMKQCRGGGSGSNGDKVFMCPREGCNKVLTSTPGLRYHMRTHAADLQPYMCIKCNKHFKSFNGLKYHRERSNCELMMFGHAAEGNVVQSLTFGDQSHPRPLKMETMDVDMDATESGQGDQHDWLRELAIIATGPQSPLLNQPSRTLFESPQPDQAICQLGPLLHSYARPAPRSRTPSPPPQLVRAEHAYSSMSSMGETTKLVEAGRRQRSYSCPTSPVKRPSNHGNHSFVNDPWLKPVWLCFMAGTKIKFATDCNAEWKAVEELARIKQKDDIAPHGLCVMMMEECKADLKDLSSPTSDPYIQLHLTTDMAGQPDIIVHCASHLPFFVRGKGWSSFDPEQTVDHYGIPCNELEVGDVCLPPSHPEAMAANNMLESFRSHDLSPMDTSAVMALSGMAKMRREQEMSPTHVPSSPERSPSKSCDSAKGKRPMNGFMLFAKRYRMEYMQLYPGKDNRAISVLLGDHWKRLGTDERKAFTNEAKLLADQQRRLHPDCWKRKRTLSTSALER